MPDPPGGLRLEQQTRADACARCLLRFRVANTLLRMPKLAARAVAPERRAVAPERLPSDAVRVRSEEVAVRIVVERLMREVFVAWGHCAAA